MKKRRALSILLALIMVFGGFSPIVTAAEANDRGAEKATLVVIGQNAMSENDYVGEDELYRDEAIEVQVGAEFVEDAKQLDGWIYMPGQDQYDMMSGSSLNETGRFKAGLNTVQYYYWPEATVEISYEDMDGNKIAEPTIKKGIVTQPWKLEPKDIEGYKFKEVKDGKSTSGVFAEDPEEITYVTYVYEKTASKKAYLVVIGQDAQSENPYVGEDELYRDEAIEVELGAEFQENARDLDGWIYVPGQDQYFFESADNSQSQSYTAGTNYVQYYYWPAATVEISYEDTDGNTIAETTILKDIVTKPWTLEPQDIFGYQFKEVKDGKSTSGVFAEDPEEITYVTYVYEKTAELENTITIKKVLKNTNGSIRANDKTEFSFRLYEAQGNTSRGYEAEENDNGDLGFSYAHL